jgi:phosphate:Na+ symporter
MLDFQSFSVMAGGLGLFLVGMGLMTEGLKSAAGSALQDILAAATRTRSHALASGMLVTALVQSSSAVTVATIGFVNAGLLALGPALWVMFGANVGTTMTGWIVALVGLKFKVEILAMPLVGLGALLRLFGNQPRTNAIGTALVGFGLLFMGIALLQQAFGGIANQVQLPQGEGLRVLLAQLGLGAIMTILMQSSSAAMTITLTAAQSGLLDAQGAAAVVIGANIGTTLTAALAAIGGTSNSRRVSLAHILFNTLTGSVALLLLPWLIDLLQAAQVAFDLPPDPATRLALFHTLFNLMGVMLMMPLVGRLTHWLQQRFRAREEDEAQPRYLDNAVLPVPELALHALSQETARTGSMAIRITRAALAQHTSEAIHSELGIFNALDQSIEQFMDRLRSASMSQQTSSKLALLLRIQRYHESAVEQAVYASQLPILPEADTGWAEAAKQFIAISDRLLLQYELQASKAQPSSLVSVEQMEHSYEQLKVALLQFGATGSLPLHVIEQQLRRFSALRHAIEQLSKAHAHSQTLTQPAQSTRA